MIYSDINEFDPHTDEAVLADTEAVYQALYNIFATRKGERLFSPEFGVDMEQALFLPRSDDTAAIIRAEGEEAVSRSEPRAVLESTNTRIVRDPDVAGRFIADFAFTVVGLEQDVFRYTASISREGL